MNATGYEPDFQKKAMETVIRISILGILVYWTYLIIKPFVIPVVWGIIIAVAVEPFIAKVAKLLGGRRKLAAVLFALVVIAALIIPTAMLASSSISAVQSIAAVLSSDSLTIPPPPPGVEGWPIIGPSVSKTWALASSNLSAALEQFGPQLKAVAAFLLGSVGGGVMAILMFFISVVIAAALLATSGKGVTIVTRIINRFTGARGAEFTALATATIRGVMLGVVGVAIIQFVLSAIGMLVAGVPAAGLWAVLVLIFAVIQLPPLLVLGPVAVWVFTAADTVPAVLFLIWVILITASESVLKPMFMGRGHDIPMLVILVGALGGMMFSGIIGLFTGGVIFAISYTLFTAWVDEEQADEPEGNEQA